MPTTLLASKRRPLSGQFVGVWKYNDRLWSSVFKWESDKLLRLRTDYADDLTWEPVRNTLEDLTITYLQLPYPK